MKKKLTFIIFFGLLVSMSLQAQRGVRIGYVDMEFILSEMDSYQKATALLEEKSNKWKEEISLELEKIKKIEAEFEAEKPLLTPSLIEERLEDLEYEKKKLADYQQKRFGPNGDWIVNQQNLIQPIQDQILSIVQQIAAKKKYDFVFDRTSDVFMLYSEKKYDISQLVLKNIKKAEKLQKADDDDREDNSLILDDDEALDPEAIERQKELDEKKAERTRTLEEKKAERARIIEEKKAERARIIEEKKAERARALEEKRKAYEAKRLQKLKEKEEKKKAYEAKKKAEQEAKDKNQETKE